MKTTLLLERRLKLLTSLLFLCLILTACQPKSPIQPAETPIINTLTASQTLTPFSTRTSTPTVTITPTPLATLTASPTPTATSRWDDRTLSHTPLPPINETISINNTNQVRAVAVWGTGGANDVAISPDGQILAIGTNLGAFLYDSLSYQTLTILQTPHAVQSIDFSTDNRYIALGQSSQTIDLYERDAYTLVTRLTFEDWDLPDHHQITVSFSPGNSHLISVIKTPNDIFVNRWDTLTWQPVSAFAMNNGTAAYINFAIEMIGIINNDALSLHSLSFPEDSETFPLPGSEPRSFWQRFSTNNGITPATNGNFILLHNGTSIVQWQIQNENATYRLDDYPNKLPDPCYDAPNTCLNEYGGISWECDDRTATSPISQITLTPDNNLALISLNEGRSEFRRTSDGTLVWEIDVHFVDVEFSPTEEYFFGILTDGTIEKRTTLDGALIDRLELHPSKLYDLDFSPDGNILAAGYNDGWIRVLSTANGEILGVLNGIARTLQFSPDGRLLAAGLDDGTVRIFELEEVRYYDLPHKHLDAVTDLSFSADGLQILTGSNDCTASQWGLRDRTRIQNLTPNSRDPMRVTAVEHSPDDLTQYFSGNRGGIFVVESSETQGVLFSSDNGFVDMALSPDARTLAVTGANTWLIPALFPVSPVDPHRLALESTSDGYALAFTPNGSVLAVATQRNLEFWSVAEVNFLSTLHTNESTPVDPAPVALAISPRGMLIALGSQDGLIHIFGIPTNQGR